MIYYFFDLQGVTLYLEVILHNIPSKSCNEKSQTERLTIFLAPARLDSNHILLPPEL